MTTPHEVPVFNDDPLDTFSSVTDATALVVNAMDSGKVYIMPDLTADCTISLPKAEAGLNFKFVYGGVAADAQDWIFLTKSNSNFYVGGVVQHDSDDAGDDTVVYYPDGDSESSLSILTPQAGSSVEFICTGTTWFVNGSVITATDTGVVFADQ